MLLDSTWGGPRVQAVHRPAHLLSKPFSAEELVARCRLLARRAGAGEPPPAVLSVQLSPTEYRLLRYLMVNAERVLSRGQILDRV